MKILWGRAAGHCSFPGCDEDLVQEKNLLDPYVIGGEMAHNYSKSSNGPQGNIELSQSEVNSYDNLILFCRKHHRIVDKQPNTYNVTVLYKMKHDHEERVRKLFNKKSDYIIIIQESLYPLELTEMLKALVLEPKEIFRISNFMTEQDWDKAKDYQNMQWVSIKNYLKENPSKIAIFSLAHIPLGIHLGFLLTNRYPVELYQYDRDKERWLIDGNVQASWKNEFIIDGIPENVISESGDCILRLGISVTISEEDCLEHVPEPIASIHIASKNPSLSNLLGIDEVKTIGRLFRETGEKLFRKARKINTVHLFYGGPSHLSVHIGRQINSNMWRPVRLYHYDAQKRPRYQVAITLKG